MKKSKKVLSAGRELPLLEEIQREKIEFLFRRRRRWRRWYPIYMATLLVTAILALTVLAAVAWKRGGTDGDWENGGSLPSGTTVEGVLFPSKDAWSGGSLPSGGGSTAGVLKDLYAFDYGAVPDGQVPILPMDLSLTEYGAAYIHNLTGLQPNTEALLQAFPDRSQTPEPLALSASKAPQVLILHTHGTEAYSPDGAISYVDDGEDRMHTADTGQNVVAVGRVLAEELNRLGVSALHCEVMHDAVQYKDSYARAEQTVRQYLDAYPSIRLVIDVHRDSILKSTGEMVRPVTWLDGKAAAQVMCVVGSSWGGDENPNWEGNLSLALQLRNRLNQTYGNLCRPPYLKSSTYNQELAPYSLLLEIGSGGNSIEEAKRSAVAVADALAEMIEFLP